MQPLRRFLILTSDTGFGHRSAANSVAKALAVQYPHQAEVKVVNPLKEMTSFSLIHRTELDYDRNVKKNAYWYRFTYEISDSRPASSLVESTLVLALFRNMQRIIQDAQPDAILNTFQSFNAPIGLVRSSLGRPVPFLTSVTDLAEVHSLWFNTYPDRFFVASERVRQKALDSGVSREKIQVCGIPVDPAFNQNDKTRTNLRLLLGLDPNLTTLLIIGSKRVSGIFDFLKALESVDAPFQVVLIAGGDEDLYRSVTQWKWLFPLHARNYVTNVPDWMMCADILITKAGGLVLSEGLAAGLPILMIDFLPGQEEGNVRYIVDHQAGEFVQNPMECAAVLKSWLAQDGAQLRETARHSRQVGHPEAAFVIARTLWEAADPSIPSFTKPIRKWNYLSRAE